MFGQLEGCMFWNFLVLVLKYEKNEALYSEMMP